MLAPRGVSIFSIMNLTCLSPLVIRNPRAGHLIRDGSGMEELQFIKVPCGKCPACLLRRKNEWTNRLLLESSISYNNQFFTLTYDELNEPYQESEEYGFVPVHRYSDFQQFLKRLRKMLYGSEHGDLRFIVCSEYTPQNYRSHYHGIFFNYPYGRDVQTDILTAWQKGIECPVSDLRDGGCSYCCKYMFKQQRYLSGQPLNFIRMSQRPPIGYAAITDRQLKFLKDNKTDVYRNIKTHAFTLPRSFKNKLFTPRELSKISETKVANFMDEVEAARACLVAKLGDELEADKLIAEYSRQRWTYLNRVMYRSYNKQNKLQ